jgi:hypothetical protein
MIFEKNWKHIVPQSKRKGYGLFQDEGDIHSNELPQPAAHRSQPAHC